MTNLIISLYHISSLILCLIFIFYILILRHRNKDTKFMELMFKTSNSKGFMLNWLRDKVNDKGKICIQIINILLIIFFILIFTALTLQAIYR